MAGTRPNFVEIKPVVDALEARDAEVDLVHTGQQYGDALSPASSAISDCARPITSSRGLGNGRRADGKGDARARAAHRGHEA
jgi:UDP-N-acetylglucosamine 2-epimerase (non-hydrolysing)